MNRTPFASFSLGKQPELREPLTVSRDIGTLQNELKLSSENTRTVLDGEFGSCLLMEPKIGKIAFSLLFDSEDSSEPWIKELKQPLQGNWSVAFWIQGNTANVAPQFTFPLTKLPAEVNEKLAAKEGKWIHFALVHHVEDGEMLRLYLNGSPIRESNALRLTQNASLLGDLIHNTGTEALRLAHLHLFESAQSPQEIDLIIQRDRASASPVSETPLLDFSLWDLDTENPVLNINDPTVHSSVAWVVNSANSELFSFHPTEAMEPGPEQYHFALVFPPDTFSAIDPSIIHLEDKPGWAHRLSENEKREQIIYYLFTGDSFEKTEELNFVLDYHSASGISRNIKLKFMFNGLMLGNYDFGPYSGTLYHKVTVAKRTGKKIIPFQALTTESGKLLNNGSTNQSLKLILSNAGEARLRFNEHTSIQVQLGKPSIPGWELLQFRPAKIIRLGSKKAPPSNAIQVEYAYHEVHLKDGTTTSSVPARTHEIIEGSLHTRIRPIDSKVAALKPDGYLEITIKNFRAPTSTGHAPIIFHFSNLPGYWDGELMVEIEKTPMVYDAKGQVGIGRLPAVNFRLSTQGKVAMEALKVGNTSLSIKKEALEITTPLKVSHKLTAHIADLFPKDIVKITTAPKGPLAKNFGIEGQLLPSVFSLPAAKFALGTPLTRLHPRSNIKKVQDGPLLLSETANVALTLETSSFGLDGYANEKDKRVFYTRAGFMGKAASVEVRDSIVVMDAAGVSLWDSLKAGHHGEKFKANEYLKLTTEGLIQVINGNSVVQAFTLGQTFPKRLYYGHRLSGFRRDKRRRAFSSPNNKCHIEYRAGFLFAIYKDGKIISGIPGDADSLHNFQWKDGSLRALGAKDKIIWDSAKDATHSKKVLKSSYLSLNNKGELTVHKPNGEVYGRIDFPPLDYELKPRKKLFNGCLLNTQHDIILHRVGKTLRISDKLGNVLDQVKMDSAPSYMQWTGSALVAIHKSALWNSLLVKKHASVARDKGTLLLDLLDGFPVLKIRGPGGAADWQGMFTLGNRYPHGLLFGQGLPLAKGKTQQSIVSPNGNWSLKWRPGSIFTTYNKGVPKKGVPSGSQFPGDLVWQGGKLLMYSRNGNNILWDAHKYGLQKVKPNASNYLKLGNDGVLKVMSIAGKVVEKFSLGAVPALSGMRRDRNYNPGLLLISPNEKYSLYFHATSIEIFQHYPFKQTSVTKGVKAKKTDNKTRIHLVDNIRLDEIKGYWFTGIDFCIWNSGGRHSKIKGGTSLRLRNDGKLEITNDKGRTETFLLS